MTAPADMCDTHVEPLHSRSQPPRISSVALYASMHAHTRTHAHTPHTNRGLAHVAGFVLIVLGPAAEEDAFWVLDTLLQDKVYGHCAGQVRTECERA